MIENITNKKYDVVLLDPPWPYYGSQTKMGAAGNHYSLMTQDDINDLPVYDLTNDKCVVFVWGTWPKLENAIEAIDAWGLVYRGCAFNWFKTKKDGETLVGSQGPRASLTKPNSEFCLWASKDRKGRPLKLASEKVPQLFETTVDIKCPKLGHSVKPDIVQDMIVESLGDVSRLEMFARREKEGWDNWGNEI